MPFNIGDRVRIIDYECPQQAGGSHSHMATHVGKEEEITTVETRGARNCYRVTGNTWLWDERLLELVDESAPTTNYKHLKVINKIKQMETRRKQMGYKTYQFVTGQKEDSGVQYKVDIDTYQRDLMRIWAYPTESRVFHDEF